jgi:hypothetical protein
MAAISLGESSHPQDRFSSTKQTRRSACLGIKRLFPSRWIAIQAKNVFFRVFASAIGEIFILSDDFKAAFLQHSYRPDVVSCYPGKNRPSLNQVKPPFERLEFTILFQCASKATLSFESSETNAAILIASGSS